MTKFTTNVKILIFTILALTTTMPAVAGEEPLTWGTPGGAPLHSATNVTAYRGDDVSYIIGSAGSNNLEPATLRFSNIAITDEDRDLIRNAVACKLMLSPDGTGNRAFYVWTDLSAERPDVTTSDVESPDFIRTENQTAGAIIGPVTKLNSIEVTIPMHLLYLPPSGGKPEKFANAIYILGALGSTSSNLTEAMTNPPASAVDGLFRHNLLDAINYAALEMTTLPPFATNISLNYGKDASEMGFTWWTPKGESAASVLQLAAATELVDGQMPVNPTTFNGDVPFPIPSSLSAYAFDVNRALATGLLPNTEYAYRVGDGTAANWSRIYRFRTFNPDEGYVAVVVGDPQISSSSLSRMRNTWTHSLASAVTRANALGGASLMVNAGDNTEYSNDVAEIEAYLFPQELRSLPVFTTIGNHDAVDQRTGAGYQQNLGLLSLIYNWPNHDWLDGSPTSTNEQLRGGGNHYFSHGNTLYISLNANVNMDKGLSFHRKTIEEAVASHPDATWKIAVFHHDIFGNGNGHSAGVVASGKQKWGEILSEFGIDFVINGHDHTHSRSLFINGTTVVKDQRPVNFAENMTEKLIFEGNPGAFVAPEGIVYMTLGSPADFPKYSSVFPVQSWIAYSDPAEHDNYAQYSIMTVDGESLTFQSFIIPYNPITRTPSGEPEVMHSSITLRKTANYDDLQQLIAGAELVQQNEIVSSTWDVFQEAITSAKEVDSEAGSEVIHNAYMTIYDSYYGLVPETDKTALNALVTKVTEKLKTAVEGLWEGQYPAGSIAVLRAVFEPAAEINAIKLSTQAEIDEQYGLLSTAYEHFLGLVSSIPVPWIYVHDIPAEGVYTMSLIDWMDDSERLNTHWKHSDFYPRYAAHFTKIDFSGGSLVENYKDLIEPNSGGPRTETPFGPANATAVDGRGTANAYITKTHAGEWIRYELNVAQAGKYQVQLGAINPQSTAMEVRLRDTSYNTLTTFTIPAQHGVSDSWQNSPMIAANKDIYLPQGKTFIELLFMNDGTGATHNGSGKIASYPGGPNVDILTLKRVGNMEVPVWNIPDNVLLLPLMPNDAASNVKRQRGWGTNGTVSEWDTIKFSPISVEKITGATHIVFDVAGTPPGNVDVVLAGGPAGDWNQQTYEMSKIYNATTRTVTIDLTSHKEYEKWISQPSVGARRIIVSHNSDSWDELNVIKAYFLLASHPVTFDLDGGTRTGGGELEQKVVHGRSAVEPTVSRENYTFDGWDKPWTNITEAQTITAQWSPTIGIDDCGLAPANPLRAYMYNENLLQIKGLTVDATLSIYDAIGALVYQSKATSEEMNIPLSVKGVYIIQSGNSTVRVVFH